MIFAFLLFKILPNFIEAFILVGHSDKLSKSATVICHLCFKKQILEFPTDGLQNISFLNLKLLRGHRAFRSYLGLKFP